MSDENTQTQQPEETLEQIEERLAKKNDERAAAAKAQRRIDLLAREKLEEEHDTIAAVKAARHVPGQPTMAFLRSPSAVEYKRYRETTAKAASNKNPKSQNEAADQLARSCWVYPESKEDRDAMLEAYPGLLVSMTIAAQKLAEGNEVDEGKG